MPAFASLCKFYQFYVVLLDFISDIILITKNKSYLFLNSYPKP